MSDIGRSSLCGICDNKSCFPYFCFSVALKHLKQGDRLARVGWNGKSMWIEAQFPDEKSKMTLPYIFIEYPEGHSAYPNGCRVPWLASQTDLMAEDWVLVIDQEEVI